MKIKGIELKTILQDYDILRTSENDFFIWLVVKAKVNGYCSFQLPQLLEHLVYKFEVYYNGEVCLYINKEDLK